MTTEAENLPVYDNGDNDQIPTCPKCGSRTDFTEDENGAWQWHTCLNDACKYEYILMLGDPHD